MGVGDSKLFLLQYQKELLHLSVVCVCVSVCVCVCVCVCMCAHICVSLFAVPVLVGEAYTLGCLRFACVFGGLLPFGNDVTDLAKANRGSEHQSYDSLIVHGST